MNDSIDLMSDPGYRGEFAKLQKIEVDIVETENRVSELEQNPPQLRKHREKQIEDVLRGVEPQYENIEVDWRDDQSRCRERLKILRAARDKQKSTVEEARATASRKIVKSIAPRYKEIVHNLAMKLIELGHVMERERELRECLNDAGVCWIGFEDLSPMPIRGLGSNRDPDSRISHYLQECIRFAYISQNDIPTEWLRSWGRRATGDDFKNSTVDKIINKGKRGNGK